MNDVYNKDNLTDLVNDTSSISDSPNNEGSLSTPSGQTVRLSFEEKIKKLAKKLLSSQKKKQHERKAVEEYIVQKKSQKK